MILLNTYSNVNHFFIIQFQGVQGETGEDRDLLYSDDEEDFSSVEEGSDSEPMLDVVGPPTSTAQHRRFRKSPRGGAKGLTSARQRNLKQKFVALLKKFKVTDPEELEQEQVSLDQKLSGKIYILWH